MRGTEKQTAWAEKIKTAELANIEKKIRRYDSFASAELNDFDGSELRFHEQALKVKEILETMLDASWWINNRTANLAFAMLRNLQKGRNVLSGFTE